jgi:trimeric autotransporter adhesin
MKKLLMSLIFGLLTLSCAYDANAQQGVHSHRFTIAGPDTAINLVNTAIAYHKLTWSVSGTVSACTVALDSSPDGTTWTAGGVITGQTCTSNGSSAVVNMAVNYVRIDMTALTIVGGASVTVTWDGYTSNPGGGGSGTLACSTSGGVIFETALNTGGCSTNFVWNNSTNILGITGSVSATAGFSSSTDGVHAGIVSLLGNTTAPAIPSNSFALIGPNSASFTSYALQPSATAPTTGQCLVIGTVSAGIAPLNYNTCLSGSGTVTSVATTSPITGGTITTTGTIACATCVVASSPGAGIAHFAGSTQTVTSSAIVNGDITSVAESKLTGSAAATTVTETGTGDAISRVGVETGNLTAPYVITNGNSTNNNTSIGAILGATGTSTGGIGEVVFDASGTGDIARWYTGGSVSAGVYTPGTLEANLNNSGSLTVNQSVFASTSGGQGYGWTGTVPSNDGITWNGSNGFFLNGNGVNVANINGVFNVLTGVPLDLGSGGDTGFSRLSGGVIGVGTGAQGSVAGTIEPGKYATGTNCIANGTAANPSVVTCGSSAAGMFSCATNASTGTCQVNTSAVTANSEIFITQNQADGGASQLNVTCNTGLDLAAAAPVLKTKAAGASFTINLGTVTTNPACFEYFIIN